MQLLSQIENTFESTVEDIIRFETTFNLQLPYDYKWYLLTQNSYVVKERSFSLDGNFFLMHHFYPLTDSIDLNLAFCHINLSIFFENRYVAFGDDQGGWQFVLCIKKGEHYGKVYFCRMDEELENALTLIADSFEEFINGLHEPSGL